MNELIGTIVAAGRDRAQWLYVTKVDGEAVYGRTWIAKSQRWSKGKTVFGRAAIGVRPPRAERPGAIPPASGTLQRG